MPNFDYSGDIDIDIDEFLSALDSREMKELIEILIEEGHISLNTRDSTNVSFSEFELEEALNKLHGKYHNLTKEEEEYIINISKRF